MEAARGLYSGGASAPTTICPVPRERLLEPARDPHVAAYLRTLVDPATRLETRIHPSDEMYRFELTQPKRSAETAAVFYFHTGNTIFETLRHLLQWRYGGFQDLGRMLDVASGFGRATRFLVRAIDPRRVHVTEIDPAAVAFQESLFGVTGSISQSDPAALDVAGPFDVITAWSFFSHLPAARFRAWMERIFGLLSPGGLLILSVHGMGLPGAPPNFGEDFVFQRTSETTRLDRDEYGTSYVTARFVKTCVAKATASKGEVFALPFGLCGYQDVYAVIRKPVPALPELRLPRSPWGMMDASAIEKGVVTVGGWAAGAPDEPPPEVFLHVDDRMLDRSPGNGARGDERRWRFEFPIDGIDPDAIIRLEATSSRGLSRIMVAETLRPYLPAAG